MICFLFPHPYAEPPEGQYCTLDIEEGSGWNNVILGGDVQDPYKTLEIIRAVNPTVVVPHSEESVLCAGLANTELGLPGVSLATAIACTERATQRQLINTSNFSQLNPKWCRLVTGEYERFIDIYKNIVVKSPVSTMSRGVAFANQFDDLQRIEQQLRRRTYDLIAKLNRVNKKSLAILEEKVDGDSIEVSGIADRNGKVCHWFRQLAQEWVDNRIKQYRPVFETELNQYARQIVEAFQIKTCGFNIEFKGPPWKVMEVHCRLGEDGGNYEQLLSPEKPSAQWLYDALCS